MSELTTVSAGGRSTRTIAVEAEDAALVTAAVRELGLESRENTSYPRALRSVLGFGAVRCAVIDVGTNSVKFHVGERDERGNWTTIVDRSEITRLGEGLRKSGELREGPMERTAKAIEGMVDEAEAKTALRIAAVGTAGLRIATNASDFVETVHRQCGLEVEVISGEEEARLAYVAAISALGLTEGTLAAFDVSRKLCREAGDARAKTVSAVTTLARADRRMAAAMDQWDSDPEIFNTPTKESS